MSTHSGAATDPVGAGDPLLSDRTASGLLPDDLPTWRRIERMTAFFREGVSPKFRQDAQGEGRDGGMTADGLAALPLREAVKLLHRHPGAPMALQALLREPLPLARCKALLRYLGTQRAEPSIDSASDEGSATCYVNPLVISEYVRGLRDHSGGEDARDAQRLQSIARQQVLQASFVIARQAAGAAAVEAVGWAPAEMRRRQAAQTGATGADGAGSDSAPVAVAARSAAGASQAAAPGYGRHSPS